MNGKKEVETLIRIQNKKTSLADSSKKGEFSQDMFDHQSGRTGDMSV